MGLGRSLAHLQGYTGLGRSRVAAQQWTNFLLPARPPIPVAIFVLSLAWPAGASLELAGLFLPMYRLAALLLLPAAISTLATNRIRLHLADWLIISFALLQMVSLLSHYGLTDTIVMTGVGGALTTTTALVNAGSTLIDSLGPYLLARAYLRTPEQIAGTMRLLILVCYAVGVVTLIESTTGITPFPKVFAGYDVRFGLRRAAGPFPHPILWGLFGASVFSFVLARNVLAKSNAARAGFAMLLFAAIATSVSSAAFAAVFIQTAIFAWLHYTVRLKNRDLYLIGGCVCAYFLVDILSNRTPLQVFFNYTALNPWTGYYRTLIWQYGFADFLASPLNGLGYKDWARPLWMGPSVDSFWLVMLLRYGLLATIPLALGVFAALTKVFGRTAHSSSPDRQMLNNCWAASVVSLVIAGFTVHYWLQNFAEFFFILGCWRALQWSGETSRLLATNSVAQRVSHLSHDVVSRDAALSARRRRNSQS